MSKTSYEHTVGIVMPEWKNIVSTIQMRIKKGFFISYTYFKTLQLSIIKVTTKMLLSES